MRMGLGYGFKGMDGIGMSGDVFVIFLFPWMRALRCFVSWDVLVFSVVG